MSTASLVNHLEREREREREREGQGGGGGGGFICFLLHNLYIS